MFTTSAHRAIDNDPPNTGRLIAKRLHHLLESGQNSKVMSSPCLSTPTPPDLILHVQVCPKRGVRVFKTMHHLRLPDFPLSNPGGHAILPVRKGGRQGVGLLPGRSSHHITNGRIPKILLRHALRKGGWEQNRTIILFGEVSAHGGGSCGRERCVHGGALYSIIVPQLTTPLN